MRLVRLRGLAAVETEKRKLVLKIYDKKPQLLVLESDQEIALLAVPARVVKLILRVVEELEKLQRLSNGQEEDVAELLYRAVLTYAAVRLGYVDSVASPENRIALRHVLEEAARIAEIRLCAKT